jgi:hypothetical protein
MTHRSLPIHRVIPAKAGTSVYRTLGARSNRVSHFRGNDTEFGAGPLDSLK